MPFTPKDWAQGEAGGTPILATELERIEQGIADAHAGLFTTEKAQDATADLLDPGAGIDLAHNDSANSLVISNTDRGSVAVGTHASSTDHDARYYTKGQVDSALAGKASTASVSDAVGAHAAASAGAHAASAISVAASGFNGVLSPSDDTVQKVAQKLDDLPAALTLEQVQDAVSAMFVAGANISAAYDDNAGTLTVSAATGGSGGTMTREDIEDLLGASFSAGAGLTVSYSDEGNQFIFTNMDRGSVAVGTHASSTDHDARYYTKAQVDSALAGKASTASVSDAVGAHATSTDHDARYYTKAQVDAAVNGVAVTETFTITGPLTVGDRLAPLHNPGPARTITQVTVAAAQAPAGTANADALGFTGKALVADLMLNGASIFTTSNRPTLSNGSTYSGALTNMTTTAWPTGQALTVGVDAIGSTTAGDTLVVTVTYIKAP